MKVVKFLQARTSSTRLPSKAMLPVGGYPAFVLAALRAGSSGHDTVTVLTSSEQSDDDLASTCGIFGLKCFRGSLEDVSRRFLDASVGLADEDLIIRLTADNLLPDEELLRELKQLAISRNLGFARIQDLEIDQPPYGLSAEIFRVALLRKSRTPTMNNFEREHVTPAIKKLLSNGIPTEYLPTSNKSFSMDSIEDYNFIRSVFDLVPDPVRAPWKKLVDLAKTIET